MHNYTLSIKENLALGSTVFKLTEESLAYETVSLDIVHGNQFNRFGVDDESKSIIVDNLMDADITEVYHLVIYAKTESMETMAFGLHISLIDVEGWPPYYNKTCETPISNEEPSSNIPFYDAAVDGKLLNRGFLSQKVRSKHDSNNSKCMLYISDIMQGYKMRWFVSHDKKHIFYDVVLTLVSQDSSNYREVFTFDGIEGNATHLHFQRFTKDGIDVTRNHTVDPLETYLVRLTVNLFNAPPLTNFRLLKTFKDSKRNLPIDYGVINMRLTGCPRNKFGGFCEHDCQCKNGATCHAWNGACLCTEAWRGPACDIRM
ncbi:uncharacterized protein [Ptychodera flava]|uniref:uncharacterized protein n=1 Tax=Ptychodera flava TaxID=63121 RepID=UPI00396A6B7E